MKVKYILLTACAASALAVSSAYAAPVTVQNFSFETSWAANTDPSKNWVNSAAPWCQHDFAGIITPGAANGTMAAYCNSPGALYQILGSHTLAEGTYTIQMDIGRRSDLAFGGFSLTLYSVNGPNGVVLLGRYTLSADPSAGGWKTLTAVVPIENTSKAIGGNLQLNLDGAGVQTVVDNVRVDFGSISDPALAPIRLEGKFGRVEINPARPELESLILRRPDGSLEPHSLITDFPRHGDWAQGGYTYVVEGDGQTYQSRIFKPDNVEVERQGDTVGCVRFSGVKLVSATDSEPVATEDWTLSAEGDELVWTIVRRWQRDSTYTLSGTPALFSTFHSRSQKDCATSVFWYDPNDIDGWRDPRYQQGIELGFVTSDHPATVITKPDTWAIFKLWTSWNAQSDIKLAVKGGYLFRRGSYGLLSEMGAVASPGASAMRSKGQVETVTLRISASDKAKTGYQLAVSIPDKETESSLKDFTGSLLNGGTVNDQKKYNFGNETDGWYIGFNALFQSVAIGTCRPAEGQISERPLSVSDAFREHLRDIFDTVDEQGLDHFGYNTGGLCVDENLEIVIAFWNYVLHTGDQAFLREQLPVAERILGYFVNRRNGDGLFDLKRVATPHWYYDTIAVSGVTTYHNALFYKAACDLAAMEQAAGNAAKASEYTAIATQIKDAVNRVLWKEDAQGGPRYLDWIDAQGREVSYFCDMCQWPALAYGIASPEQARKVVATADARIKQLEKEIDYKGYASMSALWPVPDFVNPEQFRSMQVFPVAMNGGAYLAMTYWEIVGRAMAGDREGAWKRLRLFAQRAARDGCVGGNCLGPNGELEARMRHENDGEPYLSDMIAVPAALVHGVMGIQPAWDSLIVKPNLPEGWDKASAEIIYKGRHTRVSIQNSKVEITPLAKTLPAPPAARKRDPLANLNPEALGFERGLSGMSFVEAGMIGYDDKRFPKDKWMGTRYGWVNAGHVELKTALTVKAGEKVVCTVQVGYSYNIAEKFDFPAGSVVLLAYSPEGAKELASVPLPAFTKQEAGTFKPLRLEWSPKANDPVIGKRIGLRLRSNGPQASFDNLSLSVER